MRTVAIIVWCFAHPIVELRARELVIDIFPKLATCPSNMEAASLDIAKAYRNSPIIPAHKKYLCVYWKEFVYVQHVAIEGLSTAGGIQGTVADATIDILKAHDIGPTIKWVDDFIFFRQPVQSSLSIDSHPIFSFDLSSIFNITIPLGIPWHPLAKKGHNFQSFFSYVGFEWDIPSRSVSISTAKRLRILSKVSTLLSVPHPRINKKTVTSIHGSLQHVTVVYPQGRGHLSALSQFLSKFPNDHVLHHFNAACIHQLTWWSKTLSFANPSRKLVSLPHHDLDLWVDASSSWGIGLCLNDKWAAWHLIEGWNTCGRDIGWAEASAIELAVACLTQSGWQDACIKIHCDNASVIASFWKGRSRNPARNDSICRITSSLTAKNLTINPTYVSSAANKADSFSRGHTGPDFSRIEPHIIAPPELCSFII